MIYRLKYLFILFIGCCSGLYSQVKPPIKCNYLLYLPNNYESVADSFPLLIYLHGGSQRGSNLEMLKGYGLPYLIEKGNSYDFIIASPQCPEDTYWSMIDWFGLLFQNLNSGYRIDANRVYVTGISMGGFGAWHAAIDYPEKIAAIVPLCGGCNDSTKICLIKKIPVWTFHGTNDKEINISETTRLVNSLKQCGGYVKFTPVENAGHGIQYLYENREIYKWLKSKRK